MTRSAGSGRDVIAARYGNLFDMYRKITDEDPYSEPMRIYPAIHYTMGGLWVDYNLMSNLPGLHVLGEANFSDHGANRLGASALMQGLADGYFVIPYTLAHYIAATPLQDVTTDHDAFAEAEQSVQDRIDRILEVRGSRTPAGTASRAGPAAVGRGRHVAKRGGLAAGAGARSRSCATSSGRTSRCRASRTTSTRTWSTPAAWPTTWNSPSCWRSMRSSAPNRAAAISAKRARRAEGEAQRDDAEFSYVAAWEFTGVGQPPTLHKEPLAFEYVKPSQRSYK